MMLPSAGRGPASIGRQPDQESYQNKKKRIGIVGGGVQLGPLGTEATNRPTVPAPGDYDNGEIGGMIGRETPKYSEKTCSSAALSTTNPTCCPYANLGRRGGKPATNRLSYCTAILPNALSGICIAFCGLLNEAFSI
jgi:hypothetical protein